MHPADRVALKISLGQSINVSRANGLTVPAARHVRSKSESDGSSDSFVSKLPPAVTNVAKEDLRSYLHTKRVNNYLVGNTLGEGSFAKVKEALHQLVGEKVALKVIDKKKAQQDPYVAKNFRREAKLLQMVHHPNILHLFEVIETDNSYYLITELCSGGELMNYIYKKGHLDEPETRKFMRQTISAIDHLHKAGIIHRDLKVENLLLDSNMDIRLIDFGLSNEEFIEGEAGRIHCSTQCGSPAYAAPELLGHKQYGTEVDIWSIGVNMYAMLTGCLPYTVEPFNITALHAKMLENKMNPIPDHLSDSCKDLLCQLLTSNPEERIKMPDVMAHPWLNEGHTLPFSPAPYPNRLTPNDINKDIMDHMIHVLDLKEDIAQDLVANRSTSASAIYHLLAARLARYLKQFPKRGHRRSVPKRLSQDQGYFEGEDDESMSIASCPTGRGRANTLPRKQVPLRNGTQVRKPRPVSDPKDGSLPQPIVPSANPLHRRRKTVPPTILEKQLADFHSQREEKSTFPQRPQTQLNPVRPPAYLTRNSYSQPHALNQLRQDLKNHIPPPTRAPAWHSQPNSRVGSRNPSRAGSRNPSSVNSRNTSNSSIGAHSHPNPPELVNIEDIDELQFHEVNSYTPRPKHRQPSTKEGMFSLDSPSDAQDTHLPSIHASRIVRHSSESSSSHRSPHRNGYLSSSGDIEIRTDLTTDEILLGVHRVAGDLNIREVSQNAENAITCLWRGIQFQITAHKESRYGICRLNFHWLLGGSHASFKEICEKVIQKINLS